MMRLLRFGHCEDRRPVQGAMARELSEMRALGAHPRALGATDTKGGPEAELVWGSARAACGLLTGGVLGVAEYLERAREERGLALELRAFLSS